MDQRRILRVVEITRKRLAPEYVLLSLVKEIVKQLRFATNLLHPARLKVLVLPLAQLAQEVGHVT